MRNFVEMIFLAVLLAPFSPAFAIEVADGNKLLEVCEAAIDRNTKDLTGAGFCLGLVQGITNTTAIYQLEGNEKTKVLFCLPSGGIMNGQGARIIVKFLQDNPQRLHEPMISLAVQAFREAFPCK